MTSLKHPYPKGMVFGVFDTFHKGHEYFLSQAKNKCHDLIVVVTLPEVVEIMKKKQPQHTLDERVSHIRKFDSGLTIIEGDRILGEWNVLRFHKPDIVFLGYDQQAIARELSKLGVEYRFIDPYHPEKYKSSLYSAAE